MERYAAQHRPALSRHLDWRVRTELFDDLDEAKRACDRWRRTGCRQSITEVETGQRWVRYDGDEWIRHDSEPPSSGVAAPADPTSPAPRQGADGSASPARRLRSARLHSTVDVSATVVTIWQAQGVLMELLDVDAGGALLWLESTAAQREETLDAVAAGVVERRTI